MKSGVIERECVNFAGNVKKTDMKTPLARAMITLALAIAIILTALAISAHAMMVDLSNTWCARQGDKITGDRWAYWDFIEKCHKRKGTKPCWGVPMPKGEMGTCERPGTEDELLYKKWLRFYQQQKRDEEGKKK
jgi:hypothetical protein